MATGQDPDCRWLERALADIETRSASLPWHRDAATSWEVAERVDVEWSDELGAVPRVDLHGLDQRLAREVVARVLAGRSKLRAPAVRFVTGSGTHSRDGQGVLGELVDDCVGGAAGVSLHPTGDLPWRDVVFDDRQSGSSARVAPNPLPASRGTRPDSRGTLPDSRGKGARRRASTPAHAPQQGVLGRLFQGLVTGLLGALFGAVLKTIAGAFGPPGRAFARMLTRRRVRKRRRR
ncbi:MAG: hypothetical protein V4850_18110 [Myxococcota bacterium]